MRSLLPAILLIATAYGWDHGFIPALATGEALTWAARSFLLASLLLAWRFRRGRFAAATLLLAAIAEAPALGDSLAAASLPVFATLLPLNLMVLAFIQDWRVTSIAGLLRFSFLGLQGLGVLAVGHGHLPRIAEGLEQTWTSALPTPAIGQPALLAFGLAALVLMILLIRRRDSFEIGLLTTLLAAYLALGAATAPLLYSAAGAAALVLTQVENAFSLAFEDGLTALPARRALEENLRHLGRSYVLAMIDIDHFKRLNDRHGHEVGDHVLRRVASRLAKVKGGGTAYRYGGEEFTVLFPRLSVKEAGPFLEDLRKSIADTPFVVRSRPRSGKKKRSPQKGTSTGRRALKVTVSIGAADRTAKRPQAEQVLKAADRALYRAKRAGRNRVVLV